MRVSSTFMTQALIFSKEAEAVFIFFCKSYSPKEVEWEDIRGGKIEWYKRWKGISRFRLFFF